MKKASTLISVIIAIVVLLAALGIGFGVKRFRVQRSEEAAQAEVTSETKESGERAALPGGGRESRFAEPTPEERGERQDARVQMNKRVEDMSEEERRKFMAENRRRFDGGERRQGDRRRRGGMGMSEEDRQAMREKYENMSEEERAQAIEEMRQRFGGRGRGDRGGGGSRRPPDGEPMRRGEGDGTMEENQDNPPDN